MPQFFVDANTPAGQRAIALRFALDFVRPRYRPGPMGVITDELPELDAVLAAARDFLPFLAGDTVTGAVNRTVNGKASIMDSGTMIQRALYVQSKSDARHNNELNTDTCEITLGTADPNNQQVNTGSSTLLSATLTIDAAIADQFQVGQCVPIGLLPNGDPATTWSTQKQDTKVNA